MLLKILNILNFVRLFLPSLLGETSFQRIIILCLTPCLIVTMRIKCRTKFVKMGWSTSSYIGIFYRTHRLLRFPLPQSINYISNIYLNKDTPKKAVWYIPRYFLFVIQPLSFVYCWRKYNLWLQPRLKKIISTEITIWFNWLFT